MGIEEKLPNGILLASLENENRIELPQWARAQEIAEVTRRNLHELYRQVNAGQEGTPLEDHLIDYLRSLHGKSSPPECFTCRTSGRGPARARAARRLTAQSTAVVHPCSPMASQ